MPAPRKCAYCGEVFTPQRANGKYCKPSHRTRASQTRGKLVVLPSTPDADAAGIEPPAAAAPPSTVGVLAATRKELEEAGCVDTALGQLALGHAAKLQYVPETASGTAALSRELRQVLDAALGRAGNGSDALDEIGKRRQQKYNSARA